MILQLSEGASYRRIQSLLHTTAPTISRWKNRFVRRRVAGLAEERHPGQKPTVRTAKLQARILTAIKDGPKDGSTHWSCRKLATRFGVGKDTIQRILAQADVRPHRLERYMASDDPDFETKAADVIALYLSPPQHAAVFCIDEKTAIQALDRLDPRLPLSPGRLERHGFEYRRNGTLSLYAALDVKTGKVQGKTAARYTRAEFVDFLDQVVSGCKPQREIHIILDNLSAHKTAKVQQFLERHSNVKLHFTPTYDFAPGEEMQHDTSARARTGRQETQGADRLGGAVLFADAVLPVLSHFPAFRLQSVSHRGAALLRRRNSPGHDR